MKPSPFVVFLLGLSGAVAQGDLWGTKYRTVTLNTKASGAGVSVDIANFPLLVRLDSTNAADLLAQGAAGGGDLRVTDGQGANPLAFEVEYWSPGRKQAAVWVLLPLVKGNDSAAVLRLYWGRPGAVSNSNPAAVFDTANGFNGVWHFSEGKQDTSFDATAFANRAIPLDAPLDTLGIIGRARRFNGSTSTDSLADVPSLRPSRQYTLSAWILLGTQSAPKVIFASYNQMDPNNIVYGLAWGHMVSAQSQNLHKLEMVQGKGPGGTTWASWASTANIDVNAWTHVATSWNGSAVTMYVNGVSGTTLVSGSVGNPGYSSPSHVRIGAERGNAGGTIKHWPGLIDELRLSDTVRSADWIKLSYATQRTGGNALQATPTALSGSLPGSRGDEGLDVRVARSGEGLLFRLEGSKAARAHFSLIDARGQAVWSREEPSGVPVIWNSAGAASGIYVLRVRLMDEQSLSLGTFDRRVPFTR